MIEQHAQASEIVGRELTIEEFAQLYFLLSWKKPVRNGSKSSPEFASYLSQLCQSSRASRLIKTKKLKALFLPVSIAKHRNASTAALVNTFVDDMVDRFLATRGKCLQKEGLLAILDLTRGSAQPLPPREYLDFALDYRKSRKSVTYSIPPRQHSSGVGDCDVVFPAQILEESVKRRGFDKQVKLIDVALDHREIADYRVNLGLILGWIDDNISSSQHLLLKLFTCGYWSLNQLSQKVSEYASIEYPCIELVGPKFVDEMVRLYPWWPRTQGEKDRVDESLLKYKAYWNARVQVLIDNVHLPRCLAEMIVSYLQY